MHCFLLLSKFPPAIPGPWTTGSCREKRTTPWCFLRGPGSCISRVGSYQSSELRHKTKVPSFLRKSGPPTETAWECSKMHLPNTITLELSQPREALSVWVAFWSGRGSSDNLHPGNPTSSLQKPQKTPLPGMATTRKKWWTWNTPRSIHRFLVSTWKKHTAWPSILCSFSVPSVKPICIHPEWGGVHAQGKPGLTNRMVRLKLTRV